ncbi:MAG TPA: hypothetical protein VIL20_23420 [Sandaracinaceae bacterium]
MIRASSLLALLAALAGCGGPPAQPDAGSITDPPALDAGQPIIDPPPPLGARGCAWETEPPVPSDVRDGDWDRRFTLPGLGGKTPAAGALAALDDGSIVVAGEFTTVGNELPVRNIALWHPTRGWSALGEGIANGVTAVASDGTTIYAVGRERIEDWPPPPVQARLYRWTGTSWEEIGAFDTEPSTLTVGPDGAVYAGGWFSDVNGVAVHNVAVWRPESGWAPLDGDVGPDGPVEAILVDEHGVCLGGIFTAVGELEAASVACLEEGGWRAYSLPQGFGQVKALARDPSDGALVAGGEFPIESFDSPAGGSIARWSGDRWELIAGGVHGSIGPGKVEAVAFIDGVLHIAGSFFYGGVSPYVPLESVAALRDGEWDDLAGGVQKRLGVSLGSVNVLAATVDAQGRFVVGGLFSQAGTQSVIGVAAWDGTYWRALGAADRRPPGGVNGNVEDIAALNRCALYVGGYFEYAGEVRANNVARFDVETGWHALGAGLSMPVIRLAVTDRVPATGPDSGEGAWMPIGGPHGALWAVQMNYDAYQGVLALWDGYEWHDMATFDGPVYAIAVAENGAVVVGGEFTRVNDQPALNIARWDGFGWRPLENGVEGAVHELHYLDDGRLLVGGQFLAAGGVPASGAAIWDGARWSPLGEGFEGEFGLPPKVDAFAVLDGQIVAAGDFVGSDGRPLANIARFDGTDWHPIGDGLPGLFVQDVRVIGSMLIAAGAFELDGEEHTIAVWTGSAWEPWVSDTDDLVMAIEPRPEGIYFAGPFVNVNDQPSVGLALFRYREVSE